MKKFRFRFQTLLFFRKRQEDQASEKIASTRRFYLEEIQKKEKLLVQMTQATLEKNKLGTTSFLAQEYQVQNDYLTGLEYRVKKSDQSILRASQHLEMSLRHYFQARKKRKVLETLQEKDYEEYRKSLALKEQRQQDDLNTMRFRFKTPMLFFCGVLYSFSFSSSFSFAESTQESCIVSELAIEELQQNRKKIDEQRRSLDQREKEIQKKEQAVLEQIKKLQELRNLIHQDQEAQEDKKKQNLAKLIETLLTMTPKAAAQILVNQDPQLSVQMMSAIDAGQLGKILAAMDPMKASQLSQKMAVLKNTGGD